MKQILHRPVTRALLVFTAVGLLCYAPPLRALPRKHKPKEAVAANDPTSRLYQMADQSLNGKFSLYLLANIYTDPSTGSQFQRVLRVTYDKTLYFGRFTIHVRSVSKLTPDQLATYTPEDIFNYGNADTAEFEKINPGSFGKTGDLYLAASNGQPLASAPIDSDVQSRYETLVTDYILPAVEKQAGQKQ
ncbi:MAG TPA: hypothetical protein VGX94_14665 [Terriglobia bacterium]|nr:hypothetical protein [Terriglobia bacterium]